ncbi:hypothetical protein DL96DRAFT_1709461 [Flagelloscypha sp. PMI_526]|nr:hypothetical protein DL96DRAFT_1709461 [Flagelloscypha sp. PMI_526]
MSANTSSRGAPRGRGRGGKNKGGRAAKSVQNPIDEPQPQPAPSVAVQDDDAESQADDVCWICANPPAESTVQEPQVSFLQGSFTCSTFVNHSNYEQEDQPTLIFSSQADKSFADFAPESIPYKDAKLNICFETEQMLDETLILLRFNCPDPSCDYVARGWGDLGLHARSVHGRVLCDLCITNKKVFAHEHTLYTPQQLTVHLPESGRRRNPKSNRPPPPLDNPEDQPHPACLFCHRCFFGPDELYKHMREIHEDCFLCKRDGGTSEYFLDYPSLENHFNIAHYPCPHPTCKEAKFVIFGSELDLKAHVVSDHAGDMSAAGIRDARRLEVTFEEVGARRGRGRGRGGPTDRGAARGTVSEVPPSRGPPAANRRREGFGASLTTEETPSPSRQIIPSTSFASAAPPQALNGDVERDPAVLARHTAFLNLLASKAPRPNTALPSVKSAIRAWKAGESSARGLISLIHSTLDENLEQTAIIVNAFVRLLDGDDDDDDAEERKRDLLQEWRGFEVEQKRQFPSLVPTLPEAGSSTSRVGPGGYAAVTGGRAILNAKHQTATMGRKKGNIWNRVEQAASSSGHLSAPEAPRPTMSRSSTPGGGSIAADRFPPLGASTSGTLSGSSTTPGRSTPWAQSSVTVVSRPPVAQPVSQSQQKGPKLSSQELFPSLAPSPAANQREKIKASGNTSLRNILGTTGPPPPSQWGSPPAVSGDPQEISPTPAQGGKGKKGKQKQTSLYDCRTKSSWHNPIGASTKIICQRSAFLAHATILTSPDQVEDVFAHLNSLPRVSKDLKKATHRMYAWKTHSGLQGQHDGDESGAGNLLNKIVAAHKGHPDVLVIVWRWYGGQPLGPKRWKIISQAAREALAQL